MLFATSGMSIESLLEKLSEIPLTSCLSFSNTATGIAFRHGFVVTLQQISCTNVGICVDLGDSGVIGSVSMIDSDCSGCGIVVNGSAPLLLENIHTANSGPMLQVAGSTILNGTLDGQTYAVGRVHYDNSGSVTTETGKLLPSTKRGELAGSDGRYFTKSQPQYEQYGADQFVSVKDHGAKG